jgi:hypothetical protein
VRLSLLPRLLEPRLVCAGFSFRARPEAGHRPKADTPEIFLFLRIQALAGSRTRVTFNAPGLAVAAPSVPADACG